MPTVNQLYSNLHEAAVALANIEHEEFIKLAGKVKDEADRLEQECLHGSDGDASQDGMKLSALAQCAQSFDEYIVSLKDYVAVCETMLGLIREEYRQCERCVSELIATASEPYWTSWHEHQLQVFGSVRGGFC